MVLGIHIGHDSSAALGVDGKIVADAAEERFTRTKHYCGLPLKSIEYVLSSQNMTMDDIDAVAVPSSGSLPSLNFLLGLEGDRAEGKSAKRQMLDFAAQLMKKSTAKPPLYVKNFPIGSKTELVHVEHHLAHAASAYYTSGTRDKQLIVTMDGAGDGVSTCLWRGENGKIEPIQKFGVDGSLGWFYSNVTEALGWWHGDGEGKTMGLAPYGDPDKVKGVLDGFYPAFFNGDIAEAHDFGTPYFWNEAGAIQWHFDDANAIKKIIDKHGREDVSAEAQRILEEQTANLIYPWLEKENTRNLSCAGGVFLNEKLNQRIWESGNVKKQHIYPNCGDSGLAAGAALHVYYHNNPNAEIHPLDNLYWGPEYSNEEIEEILKLRHLTYRYEENVSEYAAKRLAEDKIVAWFQGRMESGPRALGNRSILMSANKAENKDTINARVKFREAFRPFCPSMQWERKEDYLENPRDEFFMVTSFTCPEERRSKVPAVVHADGTLRPQTVKKEFNERYWNLINEFGNLTGEYLEVNTSLNLMGEPIINHPRQAIRCFYDNGMDSLVLGNYVLEK